MKIGINAKDYTKEQLNVWAAGEVNLEKWNQSLMNNYCVVATQNEIIVGFGDIDKTSYLDRLYVHKDYQGQGIATAICDKLEQIGNGKITTHASISARSFFERRGYKIISENEVERENVVLVNFIMEKELSQEKI